MSNLSDRLEESRPLINDGIPPDVLAEIERDVGRYRQTRLNSALKKQSLMEQKVKRLETTNHNLKKEVDALRVRFKLERKYFYGSMAD